MQEGVFRISHFGGFRGLLCAILKERQGNPHEDQRNWQTNERIRGYEAPHRKKARKI